MKGDRFEWDDDKACKNLGKHGVSFDEAARVFYDPNAWVEPDDSDPNEERWATTGMSSANVLLVISTDRGTRTRIISATRPPAMKKISTTGKRYLENDQWHDDNGPLPGHPGLWDPPMTDEEINIAALPDPDAQPRTPEQLARGRRVSLAKFTRFKLGLSQEDFANRFGIPIGTLRDWEQHRSKPDQAAESYLKVIAKNPKAVMKALEADAAE